MVEPTNPEGRNADTILAGVTTLPYAPTNISITAFERYRHWDAYRGWLDDGLYVVGSRNKGFQ